MYMSTTNILIHVLDDHVSLVVKPWSIGLTREIRCLVQLKPPPVVFVV